MGEVVTHPGQLRRTLAAGRRRPRGRHLPDRRAPGALRRPATAVHASDPARERPSQRGRRHGDECRHRGNRRLGRGRGAVEGDLVHPGSRAAPGLHGRPGDRRPRRDAKCDADLGGDPGAINPVASLGARDRPLGAGRRVRDTVRDPAQLRARVPAQPRALRISTLGAKRVRQLQGRPTGNRDRPSGESRVSRTRRRGTGRRWHSRTRCSGPTRTRR